MYLVDAAEVLMAAVLHLHSQAPYKSGFAKRAGAAISFTLQIKQMCSGMASDFCNPDNLKELTLKKHPFKVKSLISLKNPDQKGLELFCY